MAIQVSGSTIIHDSQDVQVSGMFTASSFVGDASQLTNLPASGGTLEATASGTLADGSKVIVNTDGTVSVITQTSSQVESTGAGVGSVETFSSTTIGNSGKTAAVYDPTNNKVIVAFTHNSGGWKGRAVVGTVSGTSITFGSPSTFESGTARYPSAVYDSANDKVVIVYQDDANSQRGTAVVGTVSGNSISFGTPSTFTSNVTYQLQAAYDSTNEKVVIAYRDGTTSNYGKAVVGTVSGTNISFGSTTTFESSDIYYPSITFDSSNNKVVVVYHDNGNSNALTAIVGTVSGTSISFGGHFIVATTSSYHVTSTIFDSTNNKVVIAYRDSENSWYGTAVVGTVSGTDISFGTPVVFESAEVYDYAATFDSTLNKVVIAFSSTSQHGQVTTGTISGTSISFDTAVKFHAAQTNFLGIAFDSNSGKTIVTYKNGNGDGGDSVVYTPTGIPVPSMGSPTVFESDTAYYASATYDSSNNKVIIAYNDYNNSQYGAAIVGTVSGTSISFGSPTVFNSNGTTQSISATFDSNSNKVVIAYLDRGNPTYGTAGTAIVGTVSGTSISFGSPALFNTANSGSISSVYDSTNQKVVITYTDYGDNSYGKAKVGTVSGTSISFGSETTFNSGATDYSSAVYDSTNGKVVIAYKDNGNGAYGTAIVGTVSGTSISFGSESVFNAGNTGTVVAEYDSTNNKVVIAFQDIPNSDRGRAIVGTVSGTSISFGTPVTFTPDYTNSFSVTFDSSNQKVVISYRDGGWSYYGRAIVGTVSGTSISFGYPFVFESANTNRISSTFDSSNGKLVVAYTDNGNSYYGTAVVFTPITMTTIYTTDLTSENYIGISDGAYNDGQTATIQVTGSVDDAQSGLTAGQAYYVQGDGTLSETADSPSVFAGTAVSASKIIVKG